MAPLDSELQSWEVKYGVTRPMNFTEKSIKQDATTLGARFSTRFSGCPHYKIVTKGTSM